MAAPAPRRAFTLLDPALRAALHDEGFTEPTAAQEAAIPVITSGAHTLLIAPTGMGKTESAVLPVFSALLREKRAAGDPRRRVAAGLPPVPRRIRAVYVTPLRALNRDLMGRLHEWGASLGIDVRVRHGDTTKSERTRQSREPPDFLITTPETLQIMFTGKRLRAALAGVTHVIVDEVHELAENERGAQLGVALERLEDLVDAAGGKPFQRVGLSATVGDEQEVQDFLAGGRPVALVKVPVAKALDLQVVSPVPTDRDKATARRLMCRPDAAAYLNACLDLIERHTSTLLFVNTRETAEVLAARVRILDDDYPMAVHHGSLSKDARVSAEHAFKSGAVRALICTSSMELGIDIGSADLVIQYGSPRQVTRLVQRVGRAGHRHDLVSNGVVVGLDADDAMEAAVIANRALAELVEPFKGPVNPLDVLANQLAAIVLERGRVNAYETYELVRRAHAFRDLGWDDFEATLRQIEQQYLLWRDGDVVGAKGRTRTYMRDNVSMIRDEKTYRVVNVASRRPIATLDEGFVAGFIEPGATFICQGQAWRVVELDAERDDIHVEPLKDPLGSVPSWIGEEIPVPFTVAQDVGRLRARVRDLLGKGGSEAAVATLVQDDRLDPGAARQLAAYIGRQDGFTLPTHDVVTVEHGGKATVINLCAGTRVNETIGRLVAALLTARFGESVGLNLDPYRIILTLPKRAERSLVAAVLRELAPASVPALLELVLAESHYLRQRMFGVARKFGAISKDADMRRMNVARLMDLHKDTPLYKEALREVLTEKLDVEGAQAVLAHIVDGSWPVTEQALTAVGEAGLDDRLELISPSRADQKLLDALRERLMNERLVLLCLTCREWKAETRVARAAERKVCPNCDSRLIGIARPWHAEALQAWRRKDGGAPDARAHLARLTTSANLFFDHGVRALIALVARGVGPDTAGRLLAAQKDDDGFLRAILAAEVTYARTRQFWD